MHSKKEYLSGDVKALTAFILLTFLIIIPYSNTFHAAWQFDDKPNIVENQRLHIEDVSPSDLWRTFFARGGKDVFYRPLPSLSFALNWYADQNDPFGYHLFNTGVHILTAFILFLTCRNLLLTPNIKGRFQSQDLQFIPLLSAALWAVNPIQTQAVTYIVQRMASMAAMFYVLAILWYAKARLADSWKSSVVFFAACCLSFICSLMSKENAVMLPVSLLLVEMAFFQKIDMVQWVKRRLWLSVGSGLAIIWITWFVFHAGWLDSFFSGYSTRPFTMGERLLSQPRVVLYYVSQIFYPLPSRLSITHDVIVSTSLFNPWTTLPAIIIVLVLVGAGVRLMRRWPLLCFAILFFLINHVVESSILALELIFEHRNYLPSLFLFLPVAAALKGLLDRYQARSRFMQSISITFITAVIIGLGCFTYTRNQAWRTETTLWQDAMLKAPKDARPMVNLGIQLAWATKPTPLQLEVAMAMFKKAISLNMARTFLKTDVINNIGNIYYNTGDFQKAVDTYRKGLALDPGYLKMRYDLINSLIMLGQWDAANKEADILIHNQKGYLEAGYFNLKGFILLWQQHPREALVFFEKALSMAPDDKAVLLNKGVTLGLLGRTEAARAYLDRVVHMTEGDMRPYFALIENSIRAGDSGEAESYAHRMLHAFPVQTIIDGIGLYDGNYRSAPMSAEIIVPVVSKAILAAAYDLEVTAFSTPVR